MCSVLRTGPGRGKGTCAPALHRQALGCRQGPCEKACCVRGPQVYTPRRRFFIKRSFPERFECRARCVLQAFPGGCLQEGVRDNLVSRPLLFPQCMHAARRDAGPHSKRPRHIQVFHRRSPPVCSRRNGVHNAHFHAGRAQEVPGSEAGFVRRNDILRDSVHCAERS